MPDALSKVQLHPKPTQEEREIMRFIVIPFAAALAVVAGCSQEGARAPDEACRDDLGDTLGDAARMTGQGIEGVAETGVAGVKQAGRATGGLVTEGTEGAEEQWDRGGSETDQEAAEMSAEVDQESRPKC